MTTDPFAQQERNPSLSFKDKPIGTTYTGVVVEAPQTVQARDFETGEPAFWDAAHTQPKQTVVTTLEINGEKFGLWAPKPSAMFRAIADAQQAAGAQIAVGGTLTVTFVGEQPNEKNPRLNPQKLYKVVYQPNDPFAGAPDWAQPNGQEQQQINYQTGEVTRQPTAQSQPAQAPQQQFNQGATQAAAPQFDAATLEAMKQAGIDVNAVIAAALAKQG